MKQLARTDIVAALVVLVAMPLAACRPARAQGQPAPWSRCTDEEVKRVNSQPGTDRTIRVVDIGNEHLAVGIIHRGPTGGGPGGGAAVGGGGDRGAVAPAQPCGEQASTPPANGTPGAHDSQTESYVIVSGDGTLVTGGRIVNGR